MENKRNDLENNLEKPQSILTSVSYSMVELLLGTFGMIFGTYFYIFWETEVGLNVWILTLGYGLYILFNAINDPLIGFLTDKPNKIWTRYGKRFPYIMLGGFPLIFTLAFVFSPPDLDPDDFAWFYFFWLLISACLYDLCYSLIATSYSALFPDKFRLDSDRRKTGSIGMALSLVGTAIASLIPPFIVQYYNKQSYSTMSWTFVIIGFFIFLTIIPGIREDKGMKERYMREFEESKQKPKKPIIPQLKILLKNKNFIMITLIFFLDSIIGACLMGSINYLVKYDLKEDSGTTTVLMAAFLAGALLSIGPWLILSQRMKNNRKMCILGIFLNTIGLFPLIFVNTPLTMTLGLIGLGIGGGALRVGRGPVMADLQDEIVVETGSHDEASLTGIFVFFNRFAMGAQGLIFAIVHTLTNFNADPDATSQPPEALFGIRLHAAFIPMVLTLIGLIVFIKFYDLGPEKTEIIKAKKKEMGL
ncbi:MAG: MFS transporter [archaeon]|nr:MFS transporter [archaeon]